MKTLNNNHDWQCTYKRSIEARSGNHCCRGKAISITYTECASVPLVTRHAEAHAPYYIVILGISCSASFSLKEKLVKNVHFKSFVSNILILRIIQSVITINVLRSSRKVPVILVRYWPKLYFLDRLSKKIQISNLYIYFFFLKDQQMSRCIDYIIAHQYGS